MTRFPSTVFGLGLAGILGAAVAVLAMNLAADKAPATKVDESRGAAQFEQLHARLDRIANRLETLEKAPPMAASAAVSPAAVVPPEGEDAALPSAQPLPEEIDNRVRELVKETETSRMEQMGNRFASMAKQRETGVLDGLVRDHGLNDWQRTEMEKVLEKRREVIGAFFRTVFSGQGDEPLDMAKLREEAEKVRRESEEEIKTILTPEQYEAYEASGLDRPGGGGMFGGGRGPGGGGR